MRKGFGQRQNILSLVERLRWCSEPGRDSKTLRSHQFSTVNKMFMNPWQNVCFACFWNWVLNDHRQYHSLSSGISRAAGWPTNKVRKENVQGNLLFNQEVDRFNSNY